MATAFHDDVIVLIQNASLGTLGTNLFVGPLAKLPPTGGPFTTLNPTGGTNPEKIQNETLPAYRKPSMQVMVTGPVFQVAFKRAQDIWDLLAAVKNQTINGVWYRSMTMLQSQPYPLGLDETGERAQLAFNVMATKRV